MEQLQSIFKNTLKTQDNDLLAEMYSGCNDSRTFSLTQEIIFHFTPQNVIVTHLKGSYT